MVKTTKKIEQQLTKKSIVNQVSYSDDETGSEQNNTMCSHETFLQFQIDSTGFASDALQPKAVP